jgi:hypothetical protein
MPDPTTNEAWKAALHASPLDLLEAEVEERKKQQFQDEIPKIQNGLALDEKLVPLVDLCSSYISQLAEKEPYADEKLRQYVFEAAMELVFGKEVWTWVKKRVQ